VSYAITRRGNDGFVVVDDDGRVFFMGDAWERGWTELPPVPGSTADLFNRRDARRAELTERYRGRREFSDLATELYRLHAEDKTAAIEEARQVAADPLGPEYHGPLSLVADILHREGWPSFVRSRVKT
jgi:hypothetical protein